MANLFDDLQRHPGLIYVAATLLPLVSFVLLLLAGALRSALRPARPGDPEPGLYRLLGGGRPLRTGAYVATAAMALSFVLSVIGFATFVRDSAAAHEHHEVHAQAGDQSPGPGEHGKAHENPAAQAFEKHWSGHIDWAGVSPRRLADPARGSILQLGYRIDHLTTIMFLMVTLIATLIHLFSMGYMADELQPIVEDHQVHTQDGHLHRRGRFGRFFLFLSLFCFSMLNLILADNLFQVFLSWELVGICSYLLVGFYYERRSASNAANKAFITNRVGDAGFIIGLLILWTYVGTFNFEEIFQRIRAPVEDAHHAAMTMAGQFARANPTGATEGGEKLQIHPEGSQVLLFPRQGHVDEDEIRAGEQVETKFQPEKDDYSAMPYWLLVTAGLGVFLGCVGKSAQFPLHVWLPDAMEGPTPVSALIHAATMVAAGVYLVGRCYPLFTPEARLVIAYTGGITLFMAATIALVVTDIKKVLAYSTVSQLGYMMLALGVGGWVAGLFHLVTHAFFKALLFLCSGSVIYGCHHEQEMTRMGGLYPKMKITAITMLIGVLTIAGLPLFSGWYSKDAIMAQALGFARVYPQHSLLFILPLVTAGLTAFYMSRMWLMTFTGKPRNQHVYEHAHESPWIMTVPLIVLAFFSVVVAWGWPVYDAEASLLEGHIHHAQHVSVLVDFGIAGDEELQEAGEWGRVKGIASMARYYAHQYHSLAGNLALAIVAVAILFAFLMYYAHVLDPEEARMQFPGIHRFLWNKWYVDELYSVILVRPALVVAGWCRAFDTRVIDGTVDGTARATVQVARWSGRFDLGIIDGMVNLTADVIYSIGSGLRRVQTGYLRSYVLFLVLAAVGIFAVLSYFVAMAVAG